MRKWKNRCRVWWEEAKGEEKSTAQKMLLLLSVVILGFCLVYQGPAAYEAWSIGGEKDTSKQDSAPLVRLESNLGEKQLVLTFDCEGKGNHTDEILGILKTNNVPAVFFVTGTWLDENKKEAGKIVDAGYEIGGHGVTHKDLSEADEKTCREELKQMDEKIKRVTGQNMRLYRPAYNSYNEALEKCAADSGVTLVLYSLDTQDWKNYGADELVEEVCQSDNLEDGAILWCHLNGKYTAQCLEPMIGKLEEKGYRFTAIP